MGYLDNRKSGIFVNDKLDFMNIFVHFLPDLQAALTDSLFICYFMQPLRNCFIRYSIAAINIKTDIAQFRLARILVPLSKFT